jgi:hypothetical protein
MIGKKAGLPLRPRTAIDTIDGAQNLYEADHDIFLDIEEEDKTDAVCDDPKRCVAARCAVRRFGASAVDFHRTIAYIAWPRGRGPFKKLPHEYVVRYTMPVDTMQIIAEFDKTGKMDDGTLILQRVTDGRTVISYRKRKAKSAAKKAGRTIQSRNTDGPRGGHHYVTGFISSVPQRTP